MRYLSRTGSLSPTWCTTALWHSWGENLPAPGCISVTWPLEAPYLLPEYYRKPHEETSSLVLASVEAPLSWVSHLLAGHISLGAYHAFSLWVTCPVCSARIFLGFYWWPNSCITLPQAFFCILPALLVGRLLGTVPGHWLTRIVWLTSEPVFYLGLRWVPWFKETSVNHSVTALIRHYSMALFLLSHFLTPLLELLRVISRKTTCTQILVFKSTSGGT